MGLQSEYQKVSNRRVLIQAPRLYQNVSTLLILFLILLLAQREWMGTMRVDERMRVDGRGREDSTDYFFNPPQAYGVDGKCKWGGEGSGWG